MLVTAAGLLQLSLGALRLGRWFRVISPAVEGMLAGIGLLLIVGQVYTMSAVAAPVSAHAKLVHLPSVPGRADLAALAIEAGTIALLILWPRLSANIEPVPGPLAAVGRAAIGVNLVDLDVPMVEVEGLLQAVHPPKIVEVDLSAVHHLDHACRSALRDWAERRSVRPEVHMQ